MGNAMICPAPSGFLVRRFAAGGALLLALASAARALAAPTTQSTSTLAPTAPPAFEVETSGSLAGGCDLEGGGVKLRGGDARALRIAALTRQALAGKNWYWSVGAQSETFTFTSGPVRRLQDVAATLSVEYFVGAESAAAITLRPGLYYAGSSSHGAWDAPVEAFSGIPISDSWSGVIGVGSARFYHHPLPVFGLVWTASPRARAELVFPEPALVVEWNERLTLRLGGELTGAGFLDRTQARATVVEFESYRAGLTATYALGGGWKAALAAGVELERSFDYFRTSGRRNGDGAPYAGLTLTWAR